MEIVKIGIANVGEKNLKVEEVSKWEPKNIVYSGDTVFFKYENVFYSMNVSDFRKIFVK